MGCSEGQGLRQGGQMGVVTKIQDIVLAWTRGSTVETVRGSWDWLLY